MSCWMRRVFLCAAMLLAALGLSACAGVNGDITADGTMDAPLSWPDIEDYTAEGGVTPDTDKLRRVTDGATKDQVYALLGVPHMNEGVTWAVHEWNYLFYLPSGDDEVACQYKVLFDRDMHARSFFWNPESCADIVQPDVVPNTEPEPAMSTLSSSVLFGFDKAVLSSKGQDAIVDLVEQLQQDQDTPIRVVGYTDRIGSEAYNKTLSQQRANAVRDALVSGGIDASRVQAVGKGTQNPVVQCDGQRGKVIACLAPNRRVEIDAVGTF